MVLHIIIMMDCSCTISIVTCSIILIIMMDGISDTIEDLYRYQAIDPYQETSIDTHHAIIIMQDHSIGIADHQLYIMVIMENSALNILEV